MSDYIIGRVISVNGGNIDIVLDDFNSQETLLLSSVVKVSADAIEYFLSKGIAEAQNKFNGTINPWV